MHGQGGPAIYWGIAHDGEELAQRIVEYREANGPFESVEELMEVSGIGEGKLAGLEGRITVNGEDAE
jgi:competence protein ComEA